MQCLRNGWLLLTEDASVWGEIHVPNGFICYSILFSPIFRYLFIGRKAEQNTTNTLCLNRCDTTFVSEISIFYNQSMYYCINPSIIVGIKVGLFVPSIQISFKWVSPTVLQWKILHVTHLAQKVSTFQDTIESTDSKKYGALEITLVLQLECFRHQKLMTCKWCDKC